MTFTSLLVLVSRLCTIIIEGKDMAVRIKFDYYHLKIDRKRARLSDQGQVFFGNISLSALCKELMGFFQNNPTEFTNNGKQVLSLKDGKKWIKWVNITYDEKKKFYKLLFTYNDIEVDPRILEDRSNNVLTQDIPDQHGQRTYYISFLNPTRHNEANVSIQYIQGLSKEYLLRLFIKLTELSYSDLENWVAVDPMTNKDIKTKPVVELLPVTSSEIIDAVNNGFLRDIFFAQRSESPSKFDTVNHLKEEHKTLSIKVEKNDSFFKKAKEEDLFDWIKSVRKNRSSVFKDEPQTFLIVQDPQTKSDVKHEFLEDSITGFRKKAYLNWEDREVGTHDLLKSENPKSIPQFFSKMIENFK